MLAYTYVLVSTAIGVASILDCWDRVGCCVDGIMPLLFIEDHSPVIDDQLLIIG